VAIADRDHVLRKLRVPRTNRGERNTAQLQKRHEVGAARSVRHAATPQGDAAARCIRLRPLADGSPRLPGAGCASVRSYWLVPAMVDRL